MIRHITEQQIRAKTERFMDHPMGTYCPDKVVLLEVGASSDFDVIHARQAVQCVPEDRDVEIVAYGPQPERVRAKLEELEGQGYRNLFLYDGSKPEWVGDGLWIQSSLLPADGFETRDGQVYRGGGAPGARLPGAPDAHESTLTTAANAAKKS